MNEFDKLSAQIQSDFSGKSFDSWSLYHLMNDSKYPFRKIKEKLEDYIKSSGLNSIIVKCSSERNMGFISVSNGWNRDEQVLLRCQMKRKKKEVQSSSWRTDYELDNLKIYSPSNAVSFDEVIQNGITAIEEIAAKANQEKIDFDSQLSQFGLTPEKLTILYHQYTSLSNLAKSMVDRESTYTF